VLTVIVHPKNQGHDCRTLSFSSEIVVIGREDDCDIPIDDGSVSRRHAVFQLRDGRYFIIDQESANGTHFGARTLEPRLPQAVTEGDFFRIGDVLIEVRFSLAPPSFATACSTREMAMGLADHLCRLQQLRAGPRIVGIDGPDKGQILELPDSAPRVLGRSRGTDLPLADRETSRRHIEVQLVSGRLTVRDLGSGNGADLAGQRLAPGRDIEWPPGATLRLGSSVFVFQHDTEPDDGLPRDSQQDAGIEQAATPRVPTHRTHPSARAEVQSAATPSLSAKASQLAIGERRTSWGIGTLVLLAVVGGGAVVCVSLIVLLFN
jgi:pSer/pThr/pTyr-binding forkhead associated (FHA) protein